MQSRPDRRGVTMLELLIALALAGITLAIGALMLAQLGDANARIASEVVTEADANNGDRALRRWLADARPAADTSERFSGDARTLTFTTLCDTPSGWREPCRATLMLDSLRDSSVLVAATDRGEQLPVRRLAGAASFRYLDLASRDTIWFARWTASVALPSAVAIVVGVDSAMLPLGSVRE